MKLKKLLNEHHKHATRNSLNDNWGDGYLLKFNYVYHCIRQASYAAGLKFQSTRFYDYDVLPLTQLPKILKTKTIPYLPNVRAYEEIEKARTRFFSLGDLPPLRANYILHESAHAIAHQMGLKCLNAKHDPVLAMFVQESFANAVESLASSFVGSKVHAQFFAKNSYIFETQAFIKKIRAAINLVGLNSTFKLVLFSFLYANFLKTKISNTEFDRVLDLVLDRETKANLNQKSARYLKTVFEGGFELDPDFSVRTNRFCLQLKGLKMKSHDLSKIDARFMAYITKLGAIFNE